MKIAKMSKMPPETLHPLTITYLIAVMITCTYTHKRKGMSDKNTQ